MHQTTITLPSFRCSFTTAARYAKPLAMKVEYNGTITEFDKPMTILKLLEKFSLNKESHLIVVNNKLVTEDLRLEKDDEVRVVRVISGG